jgi:hypothetical protein
MESGYKNLGYFFLFLLILVFGGFYHTYFGIIPEFNAETTTVVHFHAFILFLWCCVVITQPLLIRYNKFNTHRLVGRCTYFLVPLMVLSFVLMWQKSFTGTTDGNSFSGIVRHMLARNFHSACDVILLVTFYSLAIANIKTTPLHMRYMIATTLIFIDPTLSRLLSNWFHLSAFNADLITFLSTDLILVILILYDFKNDRRYKPYIYALSLFLMYHVSFFAFHQLKSPT